jgi:hypothetical protein
MICETIEIGITFHTRWSWVVWITLRPLYSWGKKPAYPSDRRLSVSHFWSGRYVEERSLVQPGIEPKFLGLPSRSAVTSVSDIAALFCSVTPQNYQVIKYTSSVEHGSSWFSYSQKLSSKCLQKLALQSHVNSLNIFTPYKHTHLNTLLSSTRRCTKCFEPLWFSTKFFCLFNISEEL